MALIVFMFSSARAQEEVLFLTTKDGLPSNTIYYIHESPSGYLWFCTDTGLSRFNGKQFDNFMDKDGLPDKEIFELFEDSRGRTWMYTYNGHIGYFENDRAPLFHTIDTTTFWGRITHIEEKPNGDLWFASIYSGIAVLDSTNTLSKIQGIDECVYSFYEQDGKVYYFQPNLKVLENGQVSTLVGFSRFFNPHIRIEIEGEKAYFLSISTYSIVEIDLKELEFSVSFLDPENNIYNIVSNDDKVTLFTKKGVQGLRGEHYRPLYKASYQLIHSNGSIWTGTLENGVQLRIGKDFLKQAMDTIYLKGKETFNFKKWHHSGPLQIAWNDRDILGTPSMMTQVMQSSDSFEAYLSNRIHPEFYKKSFTTRTQLNESWWRHSKSERDFCCGYYSHLSKKNITDTVQAYSDIRFIPAHYYEDDFGNSLEFRPGAFMLNNLIIPWPMNSYEIQQENLFVATDSSLYRIKLSEHINRESVDTLLILGTRSLSALGNQLFLGRTNGLTRVSTENLHEAVYYPGMNTAINEVIATKEQVWMATDTEGIRILKKDEIITIDESDGLLSNQISHISGDDQRLYVATKFGINVIERTSDRYHVDVFSKSDLFFPSNYKDLAFYNGQLYFASDTGAVVLEAKPEVQDHPYLIPDNLSIVVNNEPLEWTGNPVIPYDHSQLEFEYEVIAPGFYDEFIYEFQLKYKNTQAEASWISSTNPETRYMNLKPGHYTLNSRVMGDTGGWVYGAPVFFRVKSPFWQQAWFYLVSSLTLVFVGGLLYKRYRIRYEKLSHLNHQILESRLQALRNQMNPHFIFNALNSIRSLSIKKEEKKADFYLTEMASLMRNFFEESNHILIPMEVEMKNIEKYLKLEQMRLKKKFIYEIVLACDVLPSKIQMPGMLIQPILENSIWHGLQHKETGGEIKMAFSMEKEALKVVVKDNGEGSSYDLTKKKYSSLMNVEKRLRLLEDFLKYKGALELEALAEGGSKATLLIPIKRS